MGFVNACLKTGATVRWKRKSRRPRVRKRSGWSSFIKIKKPKKWLWVIFTLTVLCVIDKKGRGGALHNKGGIFCLMLCPNTSQYARITTEFILK